MLDKPPFESRTAKLTGTIVLEDTVERVFPLFSPLGERLWVPRWNPEILAPRGAQWEQGMVFRTNGEVHDAIWVVSELDPDGHRVVYYRTEPQVLVARVEVRCRRADADRTEATVIYSYVGLSDAGNAHIAEWTEAAYASKMAQWQESINGCLERAAR
jgi:hypothetical protein